MYQKVIMKNLNRSESEMPDPAIRQRMSGAVVQKLLKEADKLKLNRG
jgi:hypothetical protein